MTEKQLLPIDRDTIAMQEACKAAEMFAFTNTNKSSHAVKLASYANLVNLLYRAMMGSTPANPDRIKTILETGSEPPMK